MYIWISALVFDTFITQNPLFHYEGNRDNPCKVSPSYNKWAPWIGPHTRAEKLLLNTEYSKLARKTSVAEKAEVEISEERLSTELMNLKVNCNVLFACDSYTHTVK